MLAGAKAGLELLAEANAGIVLLAGAKAGLETLAEANVEEVFDAAMVCVVGQAPMDGKSVGIVSNWTQQSLDR